MSLDTLIQDMSYPTARLTGKRLNYPINRAIIPTKLWRCHILADICAPWLKQYCTIGSLRNSPSYRRLLIQKRPLGNFIEE